MSEPVQEQRHESPVHLGGSGATSTLAPVTGGISLPLPGLSRPRATPTLRRDLAEDWKRDSRGGPRSKLLKSIDKAVATFKDDARAAAEPATLIADLKAILDALDEWGKVDTSHRSVAAKALRDACRRELTKLSPKKERPKKNLKADLPTKDEKKQAPQLAITPEAVASIVSGAADVLSSVVDEVPGLSSDKEVPKDVPKEVPKETAKDGEKDKPAETPLEKAARLEAEVLKGKTETDLKLKRADLLDGLMALPDDRFARVAAELMLSTNAVVDAKETRDMALHILTTQLANKAVARKLLDETVKVVVVPRNKKMTDLVEFSSLKDAKTFDGRTWNEVRGSGGFRVPGKSEVYVAVSEENVTGKDAEDDAAGTSWCYDKGYSTTSHEFAHVMDNYGLDPADRKTIDDLYQSKHTLEATNPQEWVDGWNVEIGPVAVSDATAAWQNKLKSVDGGAKVLTAFQKLSAGGAVSAAGLAKPELIKNQVISADGTQLLGADGKPVGAIVGDTAHFDGGSPKKKTECYASVHRLEYFAQTANAYLGTNTGNDPYTIRNWTTLGQPDKGKRRNGKTEVKRIEPELFKLMEKLFGKGTLQGANPRKS
jgi:hypothetical protein